MTPFPSINNIRTVVIRSEGRLSEPFCAVLYHKGETRLRSDLTVIFCDGDDNSVCVIDKCYKRSVCLDVLPECRRAGFHVHFH